MSGWDDVLCGEIFKTYKVDGSVCPTIVISLYDATDAKCRVLLARQVIPSLHSAVRKTGWRKHTGLPGTQHELWLVFILLV